MGAFAYTAAHPRRAVRGMRTAARSAVRRSPAPPGSPRSQTYRGEGLIERSATLGAKMLARPASRRSRTLPIVRDMRGLGLMLAIELRTKVAPVLKSLMLEHGVIALPAGPTVLRLLPPLVISDEEIDLGVQAIAAALEAASPAPTRRPAATAS